MAIPTYTEINMVAPPPRNAQNKATIDKINTLREFNRELSDLINNNPPAKKQRKKLLKTEAVEDYIFDMGEEYIPGSMSVMLAGRNLIYDNITFDDGDDFTEFQIIDSVLNGTNGYVKINPTLWSLIKDTDKLYFEYNATV